VEWNNCRLDIGGHRYFTGVPEIRALWDELLGEPMLVRRRQSRIWYGGRFYDYPLRAANALRNMGAVTATACLASYAAARLRPRGTAANFEEAVMQQFGAKLYAMFFKTYSEKVWGLPCTQMEADWAGQYIKGLSLGKAVREALLGRTSSDQPATVLPDFSYPPLGPGQVWVNCAAELGRRGWQIRMDSRLVGLATDDGAVAAVTVEGPDGATAQLECEHVISSMPLHELAEVTTPAPPQEVLDSVRAFTFRDFMTVALLLDEESMFPDNWLYVHSPEVRFSRIQNYKNWSPHLVADGSKTCIGVEYFVNEGDDLWRTEDGALVEMAYDEIGRSGLGAPPLLGGCVERERLAYPICDQAYRAHLHTARAWVSGIRGLECIGRKGQNRYIHIHAAMMTALIAARNVAGDTRRDAWEVNENAEYTGPA
jgi:protoporphyrinogen oxidase